jgi:hypothetical protein
MHIGLIDAVIDIGMVSAIEYANRMASMSASRARPAAQY